MRGRWTRITSKGGWDVCVCLSSWSCTVFIFLIVFSIFFFFFHGLVQRLLVFSL